MEDRPLRDDEYPEDEYETPRQSVEVDDISRAVGSGAYVYRYELQECVEQFDGSPVKRFPERFDRYYFDTPHGPLLIDVLQDGTPEQLEGERARKRVAFKTAWCAEHDRRYLVVPESDATVDAVRALLNRQPDSMTEQRPARSPSPASRRGKVQRPKAAA